MKSKYKIFLCSGLGLTLAPSSLLSSNKDAKPNVLIILLDDAGYNDFGFMGSKDIKTPNIDKLADSATKFSDAHVSASVSGPSRAGILSGRYQQRFGAECNFGETLGLALDQETIGDAFQQNGYSTACIGKWHMGYGVDYHPNKRGFDYFYGFLSGSRSYFYQPNGADKPGNGSNLQLNGTQQKFEGYMTDVLADGAIRFFEQNQKPFFMYLSFNAVHTPLDATKEDLELFKNHPRQKLAAMTWAVDRAIGKVINVLASKGQLENTLIFFLSDNGGAHDNQSSNLPLKGFKGTKFEGGIRVPFFVKWGNKFNNTTDFKGLSSSLDIFATSIAAAGIKTCSLKNKLDGVSLLPYLSGKKKGNPHEFLFWRKDKMAAARIGDFKMIRVEGLPDKMYSLKDNVNENVDLTTSNKKEYLKVKHSLENWEKKLIKPLWTEGEAWDEVVFLIHKDLMNNEPVKTFTPWDLPKKK